MPSYEALLILKKLPKPELTKVLKRTAVHIMDTQGILFGIENLGTREFPHAMRNHGKRFWEGSHFLMKFDAPPKTIETLADEFKRDIDIIRSGFVRVKELETYDCKLEEELKAPAYREDVQRMIEEGRKKDKYKFQPRTGLDYNPFRT